LGKFTSLRPEERVKVLDMTESEGGQEILTLDLVMQDRQLAYTQLLA